MDDFSEVPLLVAVANFTGYTAQTAGLADLDVSRVMAGYYDLADATISAAGGRVVKFIGDGVLAVFPSDGVDRGVLGLLELKEAADRYMTDRGWKCALVVKVHYGTVAEGHIGTGAGRRYDVLGKVVNSAFRLESGGGVTLSAEAFGRLGPGTQARFKTLAPPAIYVRQEDPPRPPWAKRG